MESNSYFSNSKFVIELTSKENLKFKCGDYGERRIQDKVATLLDEGKIQEALNILNNNKLPDDEEQNGK